MKRITVAEAAKRLGTSQLTIRAGIQTGRLPIGAYVPSKSGKRGVYIITPHLFEKFAGEKEGSD